MTKFSSEFIAQQRELAGKAITVPWQFDNNNYERFSGIVTIFAPWSDGVKAGNAQAYGDYRGALIAKIEHQGPDAAVVSQYQAEANAAYITAAANNYPAALDEIERLRRLCAMKDDALGSYSEFYEKCQSLCGLPDANPSTEMDSIILTRLAEHDEIERLREAQRWIPVGERLPELYEFVTVRCYNGRISVWRLADGNYDKLCWHNENGVAFAFIRVTHWKPLPEQPEAAA